MKLLPRNSYAASIDTKDAYWHIPMSPAVQGFLGFRVKNLCYRFRALAHGLSISPRIFTKVMSSEINQLRVKRITIIAYFDNLLIWRHHQTD